MNTVKKMIWVTLLALSAPVWVSAQAFVELRDGRRMPVERILARPDGTLAVFRDGQPMDIPRDQYIRAVGIRPPQLDRANELIGGGNASEAVPMLQEILRSSAFQSWDVVAGVMLANIHLENDRGIAAQEVVQQLQRRYGDRTNTLFPQVQQIEWRARIASGRVAGLEEELTQIIRDGRDPGRAGAALLTRGDMKRSRAELRPAILDYLRAVYFFRQDENLHAEALFRTGSTFAELGESANARRFFNELRQRHPNSEFTARIPRA